MKFIVVGPYVWGKGDSEAEAMQKAKRANSGSALPKAIVYEVSDDTTVDEGLGGFCYPAGDPKPKEVKRLVRGRIVK